MKIYLKYCLWAGLGSMLLLMAFSAHAKTDLATFESFYKSGSTVMWWLALGAAVIGGGILFFSGGTATPVVAGIGTWIGGMMGLSGIAATNAGLALLGGGAIASGGFGIIGGATLLTVALTFGTEVVIDYGINKAVVSYDYSKFAKLSQQMTTLPLPKNESGPESFRNAMKIIKQVDANAPIHDKATQGLISQAIELLMLDLSVSSSDEDITRKQSLISLLSFVNNDYETAKKSSESAYISADRLNQIKTLPAFILATSLLYDSVPNFEKSFGYFSYSVLHEKNYAIRALLFAIYLDRIGYRIDSGAISSSTLEKINKIVSGFDYNKERAIIQQGILTRYFVRLKVLQQKILSLTNSESQVIRDNSITLSDVGAAFDEYKVLIKTVRTNLDFQVTHVNNKIEDNILWTGKWEKNWLQRLDSNDALLIDYAESTPMLELEINKLAAYQANLGDQENKFLDEAPYLPEENTVWLIFLLGFPLLLLALLGRIIWRRVFKGKVRALQAP